MKIQQQYKPNEKEDENRKKNPSLCYKCCIVQTSHSFSTHIYTLGSNEYLTITYRRRNNNKNNKKKCNEIASNNAKTKIAKRSTFKNIVTYI